MKIAYIADSIIPSQTANSIHVMKMCRSFAENKVETILIIPGRVDPNVKTENIYDFYGVNKNFRIKKLFFAGGKIGFILFSLLSALQAKKEKPQLIYTRFIYVCIFCFLIKVPIVLELHCSLDSSVQRFIFRLIEKKKLKKIVVISKALKDYLVKEFRVKENKIIVAPDGADPAEGKFQKMDKLPFDFNVGYIGHLYSGRGVEIIVKLAKKFPQMGFHLIGGTPEDVSFWKNRLSTKKNIIIYGHMPHKNVYNYMQMFDVLIAPYQKKVSVHGGGDTSRWMSPLKIFEYMAVGKAILSSDLPALREVLEHNRNSLLAQPENINEWIKNLERLKNDRILSKKLGENAKKEFEEKYTWKSRARFILEEIKTD